MANASRPASNDSRKLQGVRAKKKAAKGDAAPSGTKVQIEANQQALIEEVLRHQPDSSRRAFMAYKDGLTPQLMIGMIGMELERLRICLGDESPDFRYTAAVCKYFEHLRRLLQVGDTDEALIPDAIEVTFGDPPEGLADYSDKPTYG